MRTLLPSLRVIESFPDRSVIVATDLPAGFVVGTSEP